MPDHLIEQGLQHHRAGRLKEAKLFYEQALAKNPRDPDGLHLLGLTLLQSGDPRSAVGFDPARNQLQPKNPAFHSNLGAALIECGNPREALAAFRQAGQLNPDEPQYQMAIANCHALCGEHAQAEQALREITRRFPAYALGWFNLGNAVRDLQRDEEALDLYRHAIALDAGLADAHNNLGSLLHRLGQLEPAEAAYRRALAIDPHNALVRCNLVSVLIDRGLFGAAEAACRDAIIDAPQSAVAHSFLGAAIGHQGRLHEALACYKRAAELDPDNVSTMTAIGATLQEIGRSEEALPWLREAAARAPESIPVQQVLSSVLLAMGHWQEGWRRFAYREARQHFVQKYPSLNLRTQFTVDIRGNTVVLLREQGLGDEIFFLRFAAELAARGARVVYRSGSKIAGVLGRVGEIAEITAEDAPFPADAQTLLIGDLPNALGLLALAELKLESAGNAPPAIPDPAEFQLSGNVAWPALPPPLALSPLPAVVERVRQQLAAAGPPPYVAVTWRAGTPPAQQKGGAWLLTKEINLPRLGQALAGVARNSGCHSTQSGTRGTRCFGSGQRQNGA